MQNQGISCIHFAFRGVDVFSDVLFNLEQLFFAPAFWLYSQVSSHPQLAHFFEIDCTHSPKSVAGIIVTAVSWMIILSIAFWLIGLTRHTTKSGEHVFYDASHHDGAPMPKAPKKKK